MRKVDFITNILPKQRGQEYHSQVYVKIDSEISELRLLKSLYMYNGDIKRLFI